MTTPPDKPPRVTGLAHDQAQQAVQGQGDQFNTFNKGLIISHGLTGNHVRKKRLIPIIVLPSIALILATYSYLSGTSGTRLPRTSQTDTNHALEYQSSTCGSTLPGEISNTEIPSSFQEAFRQAFQRAGGRNKVGCALAPIVHWGNGFSQNFRGVNGDTVIAATHSDRVYVLIPSMDQCINEAVDGAETFPVAGYPQSEPIRLKHGWLIKLGGSISGDTSPNGVVQNGNGKCYWIKNQYWPTYYQTLHGPDGLLGYPETNEYAQNDDGRQDFDHGSLVYRNGHIIVRMKK